MTRTETFRITLVVFRVTRHIAIVLNNGKEVIQCLIVICGLRSFGAGLSPPCGVASPDATVSDPGIKAPRSDNGRVVPRAALLFSFRPELVHLNPIHGPEMMAGDVAGILR